ncbi:MULTISPECIES: hypothetical protein [unclassified Microcoleus]
MTKNLGFPVEAEAKKTVCDPKISSLVICRDNPAAVATADE